MSAIAACNHRFHSQVSADIMSAWLHTSCIPGASSSGPAPAPVAPVEALPQHLSDSALAHPMRTHPRSSASRNTATGLIALAALAAGCSKFQSTPPIEFRTEAIVRTNLIQSVSANGSLTPTRLIQVGSQVSGTLTDVKVDFNSKVKAGDVLATIDPASFERALARAEADLASGKAQEVLAEFNLKRAKELFAAKLISETEYTQNDVQLLQANANVKMREAAAESARVDLQRTTIYAPLDGMVISRAVDAGQTVASSFNTPTLFTIANDLSKMHIELAVSEADIGAVDQGQRIEFQVDAFQNRKFNGTVKQVRYAATTNQNVVTYTTVVEVANPDLKLRPGMTANASIITSERTNVLRLPGSAFRFGPAALGITVLPATNTVSTNDIVRPRRGGMASMEGLPTPPWMSGGFRRPTDEEREKYAASLTPEQKEQYEKMMSEMRRRRAEGGGGPGGGGGGEGGGGSAPSRPAPSIEGPTLRTVYVVATAAGDPKDKAKPTVQAVNVKVGITDGINYEILEGLKEGDAVITGSKGGATTAAAGPAASPFGSPFGGGRR
jgi:HlyD family secretion protein